MRPSKRPTHPPTPRQLTLRGVSSLLVVLLPLAACGGEAGTAEMEPGRDAGPPVGTAPVTQAAAPDAEVPDTTRSDTSATSTDPQDTEVGGLPGWSRDARSAEGGPPTAMAVGVRAATHESYDRFVVELEAGVPGYTVRYPEAPLRQCGSGRPVDLGAPATLHVRLRPARAHSDAGEPTVTDRSLEPGLPVLQQARLICDYEGTVEWALGLGERAPFRVFSLTSPPRLVIDVRR